MKVIRGRVVSDISPNEDGSFWVETENRDEAVRVTYTSPSYNVNNGGIFAPPIVDAYVMLFQDENPQDNNPEFYYIATIVDDPPLGPKDRISEFKAVRGVPGQALYKDKRPVGNTLVNGDGQGLITKSELSNGVRKNYTALESETGAAVSVGEQGVQLINEHMDGIAIQGAPNGVFPYRSITMTAQGPILQEAGASFNITVGKGGDDINISNVANTLDLGGCGLSAGNVRIHSQNKDITLRTGSTGAIANPLATRNINIITPGAEIQVNGTTGGVVVRSLGTGGILFESTTMIDLNAPLINFNGAVKMTGGMMSMDPVAGELSLDAQTLNLYGAIAANLKGGSINVNGTAVNVIGATPPVVGYPHIPTSPPTPVPYVNAIPVITPPVVIPVPEIPSVVVANTYGDTPVV